MAERIYLTTPFKEKDEAKNAGARWDGEKWWITSDMDLEPFRKWLPIELEKSLGVTIPKSIEDKYGKPPDNSPQTSLRDLLLIARKAIEEKFDHDVWLVAQITKIRRTDHLFLTLSDADIVASGSAPSFMAKAFGGQSDKLWNQFKEDVGQELAEGLNIRVKIRVQLDTIYGLEGRIIQIDPTVTLGSIEERMKKIRAILKAEQIWNKNKLLPAPKDFCNIAVIHPQAASGYNDFKEDADFLERLGLLKVHYIHATFEGQNAEPTLLEAFNQACTIHQQTELDALCLIRGGGSRGGLLDISTEKLARAICNALMPVFTGIGHAEDNLLLDEVAATAFDTPSKVIGHIRNQIKSNADQAINALKEIEKAARGVLNSQRSKTEQFHESVSRDARQVLVLSFRQTKDLHRDIYQFVRDKNEYWKTEHADISNFKSTIKGFTPVIITNNERDLGDQIKEINNRASNVSTRVHGHIDNEFKTISIFSKSVAEANQKAVGGFKNQLDVGSKKHLETNESKISELRSELRSLSPNHLKNSSSKVDDLHDFILQMGPEKTMKRGYALPFDQHGKVIRNAKDTKPLDQIELRFNDETITVVRKE